jgi:hypothetical protein
VSVGGKEDTKREKERKTTEKPLHTSSLIPLTLLNQRALGPAEHLDCFDRLRFALLLLLDGAVEVEGRRGRRGGTAAAGEAVTLRRGGRGEGGACGEIVSKRRGVEGKGRRTSIALIDLDPDARFVPSSSSSFTASLPATSMKQLREN